MRYGICLPAEFSLPDSTAVDAVEPLRALIDGRRFIDRIGYDFIEFSVGNLMSLSDEDMTQAADLHKQGIISVEACNCFIPSKMPLVGDSVDKARLSEHVEKAISRMAAVGVKTVVFGSGGARRIPDGFCKETALGQIDEFLILAEGIARRSGITIVIEPLNKKESNVLLTVTEAAKTVRRLDLPNLKLLADMYHTYEEGEEAAVLEENIDILRHIHIAQPESRVSPTDHPYLRACGEALRHAGYDGRVSIECRCTDFAPEMINALPIIKKLF